MLRERMLRLLRGVLSQLLWGLLRRLRGLQLLRA